MSSKFDNVGNELQSSPRSSSGSATVTATERQLVEPGTLIAGKYCVTGIIGEGAMGLVLAATHLELDEVVAVKLIRPEMQALAGVVARFAREAKAAVKIRSEHVAKVLDVGVSPLLGPYIVMEYLEGCDLAQVLAEDGPLPIRRAVEYLLQASEALASAHVNGIVHRDIKPENLFLIRRGELEVIKLLDFGISKAALTGSVFGGEMSLVKTSYMMGTPLYMSPEQIRATSDADPRSDIWSIGAVLYELVTGRAAFTASSITQVCAMVLEQEPEPLCEHCPEAPVQLQTVIQRCMKKDPNQRFQNIGELAMALLPLAPARARVHAERVLAFLRLAGVEVSGGFRPSSIPPPSSVLAATDPATSRRTRVLSGPSVSWMNDTGHEARRFAGAFGASLPASAVLQQSPASSASPAVLSVPSPPDAELQSGEDEPSTTQLSRELGFRGRSLSRVLPALGVALAIGAVLLDRTLQQPGATAHVPAAPASTIDSLTSPAMQAASEANARRRVIIRSQPSGARVESAGQLLGTTPLETHLLPGDRHLQLSKPGFQTTSLVVHVDPAGNPELATERDLTLEPLAVAPVVPPHTASGSGARWRRPAEAGSAPVRAERAEATPMVARAQTPSTVAPTPEAAPAPTPAPAVSARPKQRVPLVTETSNVRLLQ